MSSLLSKVRSTDTGSRRLPSLQKLSFAVFASGALLATDTVRAQTAYTDAGATGVFSTAITPAITGNTSAANGDSLTFNNTAASTQTDDLAFALNFNILTFSNSAALTLTQGTGTSITLASTTGGTAPTVNLNNTASVTDGLNMVLANNTTFAGAGSAAFGGVISGGGSLGMVGAGILTLAGANTYTGGTNISAGTLAVSSDANLGGTAGTVTLNGGTLDTGNNSFTLLHNIAVGAGGTINNTVNGNGITLATTNQLSGSGALAVTGNGGGTSVTLNVLAAQNISGPISISNTRVLLGNSVATLGTSAITVNGNAEIFINNTAVTMGNALFLNGNNSDNRGALRIGANLTLNGNSTLQSNSYLSGTGAVTTTLNGATSGAFTLNLGGSTGSSNSASYILNGADSAGATAINNGTLTLGASTVAQGTQLTGGTSGAVNFAPGVGTFFAGSLGGSEAIGLADTGGAAVTLSVGAGQTYSGTLTGGAGSALTYTGSGESHFQANATGFTGAINVNTTGGGKLDANAPLGSGGTFNVASGATLFLFGGTFANNTFNLSSTGNSEGLGALRLDGGTIDATSTINLLTNSTIGGNGGTGTIAGVIAGTAGFTKQGGDTLLLSGANTFIGTTNLGGSTINLSNALALQNSTLNYTGGSLVFDSSVVGNAFTFGGLSGGQSLALQNNAGTPAAIGLTFGGNNSSQTFGGNLSGPGSLIKTGTGTEILNGTNSFTGGFTIGNGAVALENTNQPGAGALVFGTAGAANTTVLSFSQGGRTFSNPISTQGTGGTNTIQSQGGGQNFSLSGGITLGNNLTLSTTNGSDSISVDTGAIGGTGNLIANVTTISAGGISAAGTVTSSGGSISLNSAINNAGTISNVGNGNAPLNINGVIGANVTSLIQNSAGSQLNYNQGNGGGTLTGSLQVLNGLDNAGGSFFTNATGAGTVTLGTAGAANTTGIFFSVFGRTFNNLIVTQGTGGTNTIQAAGGGQGFTLAGGITLGNNLTLRTYSGSDTLTATGNVTGAGSLVTNVSTSSIDGSTGGGSGGNISFNGTVNHVGTITNVGTGTAAVTFAGAIGGNVTGVTQNSATSPLVLSATNTYAGPTTVTAGLLSLTGTGSINGSNSVQLSSTATLTLANSTALADTSTLTLFTGSTLNLNAAAGTSETIGRLSLDGNFINPGVYTAGQLMGFDPGVTFTSPNGETLTISTVPEPSTWAGFALGLGMIGYRLRRRLAGVFKRQRVA